MVAAAFALLVAATIAAIQAADAGSGFMFDLEQATPVLARATPTVPDAGTPRLARRVFVVIIDGLSLNKSYELPFLDELRRRGVDSEATSHYPTWSRPNYVSILTGVPPVASGVRTNHHATPVQLDSLMDRARAAHLRTASATDYDVLPKLFLRRRGSRPDVVRPPVREAEDIDNAPVEEDATVVPEPDADLVSPFDDARYAPWPGGFAESGSELAAGDEELVVLLVGAVDAAGHAHGAASKEYRAAAIGADHALSRALGRVDLSQDAIIVVADHGHTARGGHGGIEADVVAVPLVAAGAGIEPGSVPHDARLIDIAPTVAALLGMPAPGHGLGRTLVEITTLSPTDRARRVNADNTRLIVTSTIVAAANAQAEVATLEHRAARLALVGAGFVFSILGGILLARRRVLRIDLRTLLVTVPVFFVIYYGLIGLFGQGFSPSGLPAQGHIESGLLHYGLVATALQLAVNLWWLKRERRLADRLAEANGIAWLGLAFAMLLAGAIWAVFPPPYVALPGPMWLVVIPAVEIAVACCAVTFALTLAVEVIVFAARAWSSPLPTARVS
ncbi:MAG TPA: alkaline phosphatase family protein [Kofleriaceae bacterium]